MSLRFRTSAMVLESDENCLLEILGGKMFLEKVSKGMHELQPKLGASSKGSAGVVMCGSVSE